MDKLKIYHCRQKGKSYDKIRKKYGHIETLYLFV